MQRKLPTISSGRLLSKPYRNMDIKNAKDISYETDYELSPPPTPLLLLPSSYSPPPTTADLSKLATGKDDRWVPYSNPYHPNSFTKAQTHLKYVMPYSVSPHPSIIDEWVTPISPGDKFTDVTLGFVADQLPQMAENYRPESPHSSDGIVARYPS